MIKVDYTDQKELLLNFKKFRSDKQGVSFFLGSVGIIL